MLQHSEKCKQCVEELKAWELFFFALKSKSDTNDIERGGYVHVIEMC